MDLQDNLDYESVEEILAEDECEASAAELQAILCGMLAAGIKLDDKHWLETVNDMINDSRELSDKSVKIIKTLFVWSHQQLNQDDALAPTLLPDDSYPAIDQLEAIADWCQGFLLGFGLQTGNQVIDNAEVKESLTDLADISQLELEAEEGEETQMALVTLIEHMKVAVKIIYWEMVLKQRAGQAPTMSNNKTIH
jgi:uncharacterized protein